ncbi:MAG: hypothetical protein NT153_07330 [Bacteroidetes bacterium]|nr:hypothetical protein [Bacteroidota bacterium]
MKKNILVCSIYFLINIICQNISAQATDSKVVTFKTDKYGIAYLIKTNDVHATSYIRKGRVFGEIIVRYITGKKLDSGMEYAARKNGFNLLISQTS